MDKVVVIIILLSICIILLFVILLLTLIKSNKKESYNEVDTTDLKVYFQKEYGDLKLEMTKLFSEGNKINQSDLFAFKEKMVQTLEEQLRVINMKVNERLGEGFEKTNQTFISVIERLTKIDEAQKTIEKLSNEVVSLNVILSDKKTRGIFGEVQLYQILSSVLGDNKKVFEKQKKLSNEMIVDAVIYAPDPLGMICIDSKFPLENYKRIVDHKLSEIEKQSAIKEFKQNVKKHIVDIKSKYIIKGETADQAMMFIPAEAIFAEISGNHEDIIDFAYKNQVWLVSPTTLISSLTTIQAVLTNIETSNQAKQIILELTYLGKEFSRYTDRWDKLYKQLDSVTKSADDVYKTTKKINRKFESIASGTVNNNELIDITSDNNEKD